MNTPPPGLTMPLRRPRGRNRARGVNVAAELAALAQGFGEGVDRYLDAIAPRPDSGSREEGQ